MSRHWIPLALAVELVLAGCSIAPATRTAGSGTRTAGVGETGGGNSALAPVPRQMIRRGKMGVSVDSVDESRRRLELAANGLGAQLAHLDAKGSDHADFLFKVPPTRLEALMDSCATLGSVAERRVSADDVTDQIVDTEGRLASLRASRDRLRVLMERAGGLSDVITVERELARVQGEIESLEGRLAALQGQVALSELNVRLEQRHVLGPIAAIGVGLGKVIQKLFIWR